MDFISALIGAAVLFVMQSFYRVGREQGVISAEADAITKARLVDAIRNTTPREVRADISRAVERDRWSN